MRKPRDINRKNIRIVEGIGETVMIMKREGTDNSSYWDTVYIEKKDLMRVAKALISWALYFTPPDYKEKK